MVYDKCLNYILYNRLLFSLKTIIEHYKLETLTYPVYFRSHRKFTRTITLTQHLHIYLFTKKKIVYYIQ